VGRLFYANGPDRLIGRLAGYLSLAMKRGELRKANPRIAAAQFLAVIVGDLQLRLAMGLDPPSRAEQRSVVTAGVEMFLRAYQTEGR
jgi:TetR/AcrR family transcriptional regulator, mexJK operon transcriptional repressor